MKKGFFKRYKKETDNSSSKDDIKHSSVDSNNHKNNGIMNLAKNLSNSLIQWNRAGRPTVNNEQWNKDLAFADNVNTGRKLVKVKSQDVKNVVVVVVNYYCQRVNVH